jgi:hypothetical protein
LNKPLRKITKPIFQLQFQGRFSSTQNEREFFPENTLPSTKRQSATVKNDLIPMSPNGPTSQHGNFPEGYQVEGPSTLHNHVQRHKIKVPGNTNKSPAQLTEGAPKEQMNRSFLATRIAQDTTIVR